MSTPPVPLRPARKPVNLTTVTTLFALIFGLAFGICSVSGISLSNGGDIRSAHLLIVTALVMGAVCVVCLVAVAIFAIIRSRCQ
jgi:amino acid transporter